MQFFDNIIFNVIVLTQPMLLYLFYSIKKKNLNEKSNELLLDTCLFLSFFLSIYFNDYLKINGQLILITLPILLTFLHKKTFISVIMCTILLDYSFSYDTLASYITLPLIIVYFTLYFTYKSRTFKDKHFINIYCSATILAIILTFYDNITNINDIFNLLTVCITYYILAFIISEYLNSTKEILNIHMTISEIEKEKQIKNSLFKITHEIKNPLAVVKGYLSMFNINNKEKSEKYIKIISNEIDRSLNILDDFKEFSKINIEKNNMNIDELFDDIKNTMIPFFKAKNIKYCIRCEDNINIKADYKRLKQVIINLLKNSAEACVKEKGLVRLTTFAHKNNLYIIVKDTGLGMDKDTLENLSKPFFTTKVNGTGLGVCLSKEIIEAHKGTLNYTSKINKGTIAKIVLPIN